MSSFASAQQVCGEVAEIIRPPRRVSVSEAANESMRVPTPAGGTQYWHWDATPYMKEAADLLSSRRYDAVIFVAPARTGKTVILVDGLWAYALTSNPGDMLVVQISEEKAREFSKKRIDRAIDNSPDLRNKLSSRAHDNNVHDKIFRSGMYLKIGWPTKNILASSDYKYVAITDYDRLAEDIGGEGAPFALGQKRTQTFMSAGMTMAESSPGHEILDPHWRQPEDEPHRAPPSKGVLALYNQGDRRRWYWQCPHCSDWFQPVMEHFNYESARLYCPHCAGQIEPSQKRGLNANGRWVPEGCYLDADGNLNGEKRRTRIASFWLEGPAAAFQTWDQLADRYNAAMEDFESTGSIEALKSTVNVDQGRPFKPLNKENDLTAEDLQERSEELGEHVVPNGVRFLTAAVDVQKDRFVVQVEGVGLNDANELERWQIDRYDVRKSERYDEDNERMPIRPATYTEDWDLLVPEVLEKTYPLQGLSDQRMRLARVAIDSGGRAGVTEKAYTFWRSLKKRGLAKRVRLIKGASSNDAPRIRQSYPDSDRKDRKAGARGQVPVHLINTTVLKDAVSHDLNRTEPGVGFIHFPDWLPFWFFRELCSEYRDVKRWHKVSSGARNEAFDLMVYNRAIQIELGIEKIDWAEPPPWASPWEQNTFVLSSEPEPDTDDEAPARKAGVSRSRRRRRASSSYLR